MAVRQLKSYVSWVQTVKELKHSTFLQFESEEEDIATRRRYTVMCIEKLMYIGKILRRTIPREFERNP